MKKNMQKLMSILSVSAISASMLAGCGGQTQPTTPDTSNPTPSATEQTATDTTETTETTEAQDTTETETTATSDGSTPRNETVYWAGQQWGTINDYNPFSANSNNGMFMTQNDTARELMYETLFMYNPLDGSMKGLLAQGDYEWNDDQTVMTIKLNPDAKWSDGTQVTAEDVAYTWATHVKYSSSIGVDYPTYIADIKAVDDTTVEIDAATGDDGKAVNPLRVLNYIDSVYVTQKAYIQSVEQSVGEDAEKFKTAVMDDAVFSGPYGPYISNDQKVVGIRNENYWGQAASMWGKLPVPKYIAHNIFKDNAAGQTALSQGEVDVCQQFITGVQDLWEKDNLPISTWLDEAPYNLCVCMPSAFFNTEVEGLDQVEVRKAIAMAVDYDQINSSAMSGQCPSFADVPQSIASPSEAERAYVDMDQIKDLAFPGNDIDGANKLLDDAGIVDTDGDGIREYNGKNLSFKAECPQGWSDWNASMEIVAAAGANIGIDISTYFPEANTFYDDLTNGKFEIAMWSSPGVTPSGLWSKAMFYFSQDFADIEEGNWSGNFGDYYNDDAEAILDAIPTETDDAKLKEYYTELSKILLTEVPAIELMYRPQLFYAVNETVWTNYPAQDDGRGIPPTDCTDGYGIAALYELELVQ